MGSAVSNIVGVAAPIVGAVFGGPAGAAIGATIGAKVAQSPTIKKLDTLAGLASGAYGLATGNWGSFGDLGNIFGNLGGGGVRGGIFSLPGSASTPIGIPSSPGGLSGILGGMSSGGWGSVAKLGLSLYDIYSSEQQRKLAEQLAAQADPFAAHRAFYASQLARLQANPASYMANDPSYKFMMDQGLEAIRRRMAAGGYAHSGNELLALQEYGQGLAAQTLFQEKQRLAALAGAGIDGGATAAKIALMGQQALPDAIGRVAGLYGIFSGADRPTSQESRPSGGTLYGITPRQYSEAWGY
jgi:hypothetical protein